MIETRGISKSYGDLKVLKNINLKVAQGGIVCIVGASGAGKTTLLQIIGTLGKPDKGEVFVNDVEVSHLKEKELARFRNRNIGFVFQFHQLLPEFTAIENVCIPAFIAGTSYTEAMERANEILSFLSLPGRLHHKPSELSGGEQQRVAVARALINNPAVILADEPSGNLDTKNKQELHELFFTLREKFNQTFVIVTHDMSLAEMSDRIVEMKDGEIVGKQRIS